VSFESSFVPSTFAERGIGKGGKAEGRVFYSTASKPKPTRPQATGSGEGLAGVRFCRMASDEDYMAFLDKANRDPNEGAAKTQGNGKVELKAVDAGVRVPPGLKKATSDAFYVSDADEPFVPVCLKFEGKKLPDEGQLLQPFCC
jgi:hypothetical protein